MYFHSQNKTDPNITSRLEIAYLLDSGASFPVRKIPTYIMITQWFIGCTQFHYDTSKIFTFTDPPRYQVCKNFL